MKPHEKLGVAIADAGYDWTPEMRSAWEELDRQADRIAELEKTMGERLNDLNTRQVEDERTSLVSTPPYAYAYAYAYAVIQGEDGKENVSLQFDHPEMCGQKYKQAIPLFTTPQTKPLSNDEILEMTIWNKNLYELYVEMEKEDMIAFARAIEERHGIK